VFERTLPLADLQPAGKCLGFIILLRFRSGKYTLGTGGETTSYSYRLQIGESINKKKGESFRMDLSPFL